MPKIKNAAPLDTALNEFVYTAIFKADYEQKRHLTGKFLKATMSEKCAKSFCDSSTREEKEIILTALGYEFCYILNATSNKFKVIQEVLPILETGKKGKISKEITERGFFVTTDKQLLRTLGLVGQITHSPSYFMDLEILRHGYNVRKWSKRYDGEKNNVYRGLDEAARAVALSYCNASLCLENAKLLFGCPTPAMRILLKLYASTTDVTDENLKDFFFGRVSGKEYGSAIRFLMDEHLIVRVSGTVSITGAGIKKINQYIYSVTHSNNF